MSLLDRAFPGLIAKSIKKLMKFWKKILEIQLNIVYIGEDSVIGNGCC